MAIDLFLKIDGIKGESTDSKHKDEVELLSFEPAVVGLARARVAVRCGKGTYVRTIAATLGAVSYSHLTLPKN
jgi:type VI protein secretion system component Hcp